jgi:signal transduction histidine kinase
MKSFGIVYLLLFLSFVSSFGFPEHGNVKKILLINSYHQGYAWTDSLTSGIIQASKAHPELVLYIESLNAKQFGNSKFEIVKEYFKEKYSGIAFDGVMVTDNDALDFAFQYDQELFPNVPVVFAGISNPENYQFEGSMYYGIKETGSSEFVLGLVRDLLPELKQLLVIADKTTTGLVYRKEFALDASNFDHLSVIFPEVIDLDSIYSLVRSNLKYDAIFYAGISQDKNGRLIDPVPVIQKICELTTVPVFTNDPLNNCPCILGGLFRSGKYHGDEAVKLMTKLLNTNNRDSIKHVYTTEQRFFFDHQLLDKYDIPVGRLPVRASVFNRNTFLTRENFRLLLGILVLLSFIIVVLSVVNRRRKLVQKRGESQLREIEIQKQGLEEAQHQLGRLISELEYTNDRLKETNVSLLEAKKKAEESDNLKSAFLANVSHEIRTPLNSIVGFSSLLIDPNLDEVIRKTYVDLIESNTESLLVLIDEIMDLSKIEAQQLTLKMQDFSIDGLMEELFAIFNQVHKKHAVELRIAKPDPGKELFVFSDRVRVRQVFVNLLTNALKFTDSGYVEMGYLLLGNEEFALYVKDSGIGISKEHHEAIFQRFRKLNENVGKIYRGTGLGLAITKKLTELLGGRIWIESEPGQGSTFFFTLQDCQLKAIRSRDE